MRKLLLAILVVAAAGCGTSRGRGGGGNGGTGGSGGTGGTGGSGDGTTFSEQCNGAATTISGAVVAPNAVDPVANAYVYIQTTAGTFPPTVSCELCGQPIDGSSASTNSGADGHFSLDVSHIPAASTLPFTVNIGRFRRTMMVPVTACQDNPIGSPFTQLPGKLAAGVDDIPKIAVSTGNKDQLDAVLAAMGMDQTAGFDCFEGRKTSTTALTSPCGKRGTLQPIENLLKDSTTLANYNIVFLSCAPGKFASLSAADQQTIVANLQQWTGKGGRLFATDNSYDYIAQAFPNDVSFMNGDTTVDNSNVGVGGSSTMPTSYQGQVNDATLQAWLTAVSALTSGSNQLTLSGYLNHWSVIQSVPSTTSDVVDATNAVAYTTPTSTTPGAATSYPQTIRFDVTPAGGTMACGRAIYTSYHTLPATMSVDATQLAPQERVLEFLMLEAGSCVGPIG